MGVVKIMVPSRIIQHLVFRGPKWDHNLNKRQYQDGIPRKSMRTIMTMAMNSRPIVSSPWDPVGYSPEPLKLGLSGAEIASCHNKDMYIYQTIRLLNRLRLILLT